MSSGYDISDNSGGPEWSLERASFKDHYERRTSGTTTKLFRCRQYTIVQRKRVFGLTSIGPENRNSKANFDLFTGPGTQVQFSWIGGGRKFICTMDDVQVVDLKTGEAVIVQMWEHFSKWKEVEGSDFSEDDDSPPGESPGG